NVREIVARRGSFDALWQLARLREAGLIELESGLAAPRAPGGIAPVSRAPEIVMPVPPAHDAAPPLTSVHDAETLQTEPAIVSPALTPVTPVPGPREEPVVPIAAHCPKLGFEDDPSSSFGRPTRLHRCFAAGKPLPLSLDQQRELCLSEQYPTCPRLVSAA